MENWDDLRFLLAVSKAGTMSGAARLLNTNVATVSRRIDRLSEQLGTNPFQKTRNGWETNPMVQGLIDAAQTFEGSVDKEINNVSTNEGRQIVRIGAPPIVSSQILFPALIGTEGRMKTIAPEFSDRLVPGGLGDHDIVIQDRLPETGRLLSRKAGAMVFRVYAPKGYNGTDWVSLPESSGYHEPTALGRKVFGTDPVARASTFMQMFELAQQNGLAVVLPEVLAHKHENWAPIGSDNDLVKYDLFVLYHETRKGDPVIDATLEWINYAFAKAKADA